ncbi:MAG: ABC transporter permease, partial [Terriglobales bacterium]
MNALYRRLRWMAGWRRRRRELREEMALHEELAAGAGRRMGNELQLLERSQRVWVWRWLDELAGDVRHGLRLLGRTPLVTALALASLALGIGANTAAFSLAEAVIFRPLPVAAPQQLVQFHFVRDRQAFSDFVFDAIRDNQHAFSAVWAEGNSYFTLSPSPPVTAHAVYVSGSYFSALGLRPERGRFFDARDDSSRCPLVAVISDAFWHSHFGGVAAAVGATLPVRGHAVTIIGVTPRSFFGTEVGQDYGVAFPLCAQPVLGAYHLLHARGGWLALFGRRRAGVTPAAAQADLDTLQAAVKAALPADTAKAELPNYRVRVESAANGSPWLRGGLGLPLESLLVVTGLVLLLACANLSGLMLARASARRAEIATRVALGAGRLRLVRQLLTETALLAVGGAGLGSAAAAWACGAVVRFWSPPHSALRLNLTPDSQVLGFTAAVTVLTALLVGLGPALGATRAGKPGPRRRPGRWLAAAQLAMALVLLAAAGLFLRSFRQLTGPAKGFNARGLTVVTSISYQSFSAIAQAQLEARLRALPGVAAVSASEIAPTQDSFWGGFELGVAPASGGGGTRTVSGVYLNAVSPGYFAMLSTPLLAGRAFDDGDRSGRPPVAVVNQRLARSIAPGGTALDRYILLPLAPAQKTVAARVVGIVADAKYSQLDRDAPPTAYIPLAMSLSAGTWHLPAFYLRSPLSTAALARETMPLLSAASPRSLITIEPFTELVDRSVTPQQMLALLSELFGGLALLLAALGLYGVVSFNAARRRAEFGIRVALGATPAAIARLVLADAAATLALGASAGAALAWLGGRAAAATLGQLLYGVGPTDAASLLGAAALLAALA